MNSITEYKKAKLYTDDLSKALETINKTLESLKSFRKYAPVKECLNALEEQKSIIQIHYEHYKRVLETKGKI